MFESCIRVTRQDLISSLNYGSEFADKGLMELQTLFRFTSDRGAVHHQSKVRQYHTAGKGSPFVTRPCQLSTSYTRRNSGGCRSSLTPDQCPG